jgi:CRP-like cAMP-binding protein
MVEKSELLRVPIFADLPDDQLDWFIAQSQELHVKAGDSYSRQGEPADAMFVILEGRLQGRGEIGGETVTFSIEAGNVTGVLPFSRMKQFTVSIRAETDSCGLRFPASLFPDLVQKMPELTKRLVGLMSDRIRETTRLEQQRDRLASLGKLSAGLAHELNNPASAAKRAASQLRDALKRIRDASHELGRRSLTPAQKSEILAVEESFVQQDTPRPVATSGRSGTEKRPARSSGIAVRISWRRHSPSRPREDRRFGGDRYPAERNREQYVAYFRSGLRDQGIHVHGSGAGTGNRYSQRARKHADDSGLSLAKEFDPRGTRF